MSDETTPAVERAAEALVLSEGILDWSVLPEHLRETPRDQARAILTAAVDVEEIAQALYRAISAEPEIPWEQQDVAGKRLYYVWAQDIRTAILGSD